MSRRYPAIDPDAHGWLAVGAGHSVYWETCGNPHGIPVLVLHGGPGSGCTPASRRFFDPAAFRIVLFDQRNCGRSTPHASDPAVDLATNTTPHLLRDIEALRELLGIERWLLYGGSWGVTLGLAYAQWQPERVLGMVGVGITTTRQSEIDWLYRGVAPLFPAQFARFRDAVPESERAGDLVAAYYRLLQSDDPAVRRHAATEWNAWENSLVSVNADAKPSARRLNPDFQMAWARIVTHYFHHRAWLEDGQLLRDAHKLAGIPATLIQGRLDLAGPLVTAWELAQAWPDAELVVVDNAGHSAADKGMTEAILAATDSFARRLR